ncbi:CST complex subunit CTC1-like [Thalassophryne amazonica]|uniref:CST complex subunit CTC1-like n=1 Tax=Thalassophryne amazonica TaxID=390379 RepID=UPI001471E015|nr:CST complex subunit CTC1-like [Thalassophryne amazonica]
MCDGKVGLCLAYQPALRRKLRPGDSVELHSVHFLYRPCPDFLPFVLCACLRSSLRVTTFSRVVGLEPDVRCPGDGVLPRLLVQRNVGVAEYLWVCHLTAALRKSLIPSVPTEQCVCLLSWKLMELVFGKGGAKRDIYSEMLDEQDTCPLTQYSLDSSVPQFVSLSQCSDSLHSNCWSDFSLSSLLPPDGSSLTRADINAALSWSFQTVTFDPCLDLQTGDRLRRRPLLLVGVLALPSQTCEHTLRLRDHTGAMACVVTETSEEEDGGQRATFNTAWLGCLVCVRQFTTVTERFIQSDFPSCRHLQQDGYITDRHCRVYLQFSLDHAHVLSPSVAMVTHRQREEPGGDDHKEEEEPQSQRKKGKTEEGQSASRPCVSMVIRVEQKEGVSWRNSGAGLRDKEAGLSLCFCVRAAVIGPVVIWEQDPKNGRMLDREAGEREKDKVALWFTGVSACWFPVLQPGCFYRLVAANTQDPSVLIGSGVCKQSRVECHADSTLQVHSDWRFHTLTRPLLLPAYKQALSLTVMSVSEVLDCR